MGLIAQIKACLAPTKATAWKCPLCLHDTYSRVLATRGMGCNIVATDSVQCEGCKETFPLLQDKAA